MLQTLQVRVCKKTKTHTHPHTKASFQTSPPSRVFKNTSAFCFPACLCSTTKGAGAHTLSRPVVCCTFCHQPLIFFPPTSRGEVKWKPGPWERRAPRRQPGSAPPPPFLSSCFSRCCKLWSTVSSHQAGQVEEQEPRTNTPRGRGQSRSLCGWISRCVTPDSPLCSLLYFSFFSILLSNSVCPVAGVLDCFRTRTGTQDLFWVFGHVCEGASSRSQAYYKNQPAEIPEILQRHLTHQKEKIPREAFYQAGRVIWPASCRLHCKEMVIFIFIFLLLSVAPGGDASRPPIGCGAWPYGGSCIGYSQASERLFLLRTVKVDMHDFKVNVWSYLPALQGHSNATNNRPSSSGPLTEAASVWSEVRAQNLIKSF